MGSIRWLKWEPEAFFRARKEHKPILLDIVGKWCHWCHRMDEDTYGNSGVIENVNKDFIPIRVDTDKRPDINDRYNQGGWPTTAFLDSAGKIITGATYLQPHQFLQIAGQVTSTYGTVAEQDLIEHSLYQGSIGEEIPLSFLETVKSVFDPSYGGFGQVPKFPMPDVLEFLLGMHAREKDSSLLEMVEKSVRGMQGIFDPVEGGYYRYSVTRNWNQPHYEKMLETNADMIRVLSLLYSMTKSPVTLKHLKKTVAYVLKTLASPHGGFFASQDANGENVYYGKSLKERSKLPTPVVDTTIFTDLNGKALRGMLAYLSVEKDEQVRAFVKKTCGLFMATYYSPGKGFAHYVEREPVFLGLLRDQVNMGLAMAEAAGILENDQCRKKAVEVAGFISRNFRDKKGGFFDSLGRGEGLLRKRMKKIDENSRAAQLLVTVGKRGLAREALSLFAQGWQAHGIMAGGVRAGCAESSCSLNSLLLHRNSSGR